MGNGFAIKCADCGAEFTAKVSNALRCRKCAAAHVRQSNKDYQRTRKYGSADAPYKFERKQSIMICENCGKETVRNSGNQRYCLDCSLDIAYRRAAEYKQRESKKSCEQGLIIPVGAEMQCPDCGKTVIKRGTRQIRCPDCAKLQKTSKEREAYRRQTDADSNRKKRTAAPKVKTLAEMEEVGRKAHASYGKLTAPTVTVFIPPEFRTPREG